MKSFVVIACLLQSGASLAQRRTPPGTAAENRLAITALEQRIGQANFDCDYTFFAQVEGDEFIFTDPSGSVTTRAEDLAGEKSCRPRKGTYLLDEVRFSLHGAVAVFNARSTTAVANAKGEAVVRKSRFTDVLVWRDGRWQLIAGHASRIS